MAKRTPQTEVPQMMPPAEPPADDVLEAAPSQPVESPAAAGDAPPAAADLAPATPTESEIEAQLRATREAHKAAAREKLTAELAEIDAAIAEIGDPDAEIKPIRDALHAAQNELADTTVKLREKVEKLQQQMHELWHGTKVKSGTVRVGGMQRAVERENLLRNRGVLVQRIAELG